MSAASTWLNLIYGVAPLAPTVTAPIVGATRLEHLDSAIAALDLELTNEECETLESPYRPHAVRGWQ